MFVASLTRRFVSAKRLFRDLSEFKGKLVEHRAQSPVHLRTGLWARCSTSLPLNSKRSLKSLLAETKRRVRLATNISQEFAESAGKIARASRDWFWFSFSLIENLPL